CGDDFQQVSTFGAGIDNLSQWVLRAAGDATLDHERDSTTAAAGPGEANMTSDLSPATAKASRMALPIAAASQPTSAKAATVGPAPLMTQPYAPACQAAAQTARNPGSRVARADSKMEPFTAVPNACTSPRASASAESAPRATP